MTDLQLPDFGSVYCCRVLATEACCQLVAQDVISAPASPAFIERLFSVCGLLTKGTRHRMEKSLYTRAWLKVNFDELSEML